MSNKAVLVIDGVAVITATEKYTQIACSNSIIEATAEPVKTTTCQICGRSILANTGLISHHGYKRPGGGWQTKSCAGARHLPYEQSCDLIPVIVGKIGQFVIFQAAAIDEMMTNPPATVEQSDRSGYRTVTYTAERPSDFDPNKDYYYPKRTSYEYMFAQIKSGHKQNIKAAQEQLEFLKDRLAKWVAPVKEQANV